MYPQRPEFGIEASNSAWWKVENPLAGKTYVCATNGAGFIAEVKRYAFMYVGSGISDESDGTLIVALGRLTSLLGRRAPAATAIATLSPPILRALFGVLGTEVVSKPDASGTIRLSNANLGVAATSSGLGASNSKWTEATVSFLASWFRRSTGGEITATSYDRLLGQMPQWARTVHLAAKNEFVARRIGPATLRMAAWFVTTTRDFLLGGRMGGGGNVTLGMPVTDFRDITVDGNAAGPPWDEELPGMAETVSCRELRGTALAPRSSAIVWRQTPGKMTLANVAKLTLVCSMGGALGWAAVRYKWI